MAVSTRSDATGEIWRFTLCLADPKADTLVAEIDPLRRAVRQALRFRPVDVLAWTILPNKMHAVWRLPGDDDLFSARWRQIKTRFWQEICTKPPHRATSSADHTAIWVEPMEAQRITGPQDLRNHLNACWHSPVDAGLVSSPHAWPYSSLQRHAVDVRRAIA